ncbi:hypothetical protein Goklo_003118, partial [Gossypium klotzschianum]|nr:hypothetical protein [Gossypium klotzschianum]
DNPKGLQVFFLPIGALPSPPPWGWSTGFVTTPLTPGRLLSQHLDSAIPKIFWFTPTFPTCPTVAEQFLDIKRTSPEGNFNVADFPSFTISFTTTPTALANCPPLPSVISMLCMTVPKGISVEKGSGSLTCDPDRSHQKIGCEVNHWRTTKRARGPSLRDKAKDPVLKARPQI